MKERPLQVDLIVGYEAEINGAYDNDWYWVESDQQARTVINRWQGEKWWTELLNEVAYERTAGDMTAYAHIYIGYIVTPTGTDVHDSDFDAWEHWVGSHTVTGIPPATNQPQRRHA